MGLMGGARLSDYAASKFGLVGFYESVRMELANDARASGVSVVTVCPFAVSTGMFDGIFEGSRWNRFVRFCFPPLSAKYTAACVLGAAERRQPLAMVPFYLGPLIWATRCLPDPFYDWVVGLAGGRTGMDTFRGPGLERRQPTPHAAAAKDKDKNT